MLKEYHITVIVRGRKSSQISRIWKHLWMFSCTFCLGRNFYIWDCLNCKSFLTNYGKEGNSRNFSSADDSRYTVSQYLIIILEYNFNWYWWCKMEWLRKVTTGKYNDWYKVNEMTKVKTNSIHISCTATEIS